MATETRPTADLPFWQRIVITVLAMLLASFLFGQLWQGFFGTNIPSFVAGMVGGLFALPVWEALKKVRIDRAQR